MEDTILKKDGIRLIRSGDENTFGFVITKKVNGERVYVSHELKLPDDICVKFREFEISLYRYYRSKIDDCYLNIGKHGKTYKDCCEDCRIVYSPFFDMEKIRKVLYEQDFEPLTDKN